MRQITLNDGYSIPELGLGTYRLKPSDAYRAVKAALACGFRHIDTANVYFNEQSVGRAISDSGVPREEIYLTSKIFPNAFKDPDKAIDDTLERLGTPYLDLLLIHRPYGDYVGAYKALVRAKEQGKVRSVGVSNLNRKQIEKVYAATGVMPVINQIELNPYFLRDEERAYLKDKGIAVEAWCPFGSGNKALLSEPVLVDIAKNKGKSVPQVILRFLLNKDIIVFPGSKNEEHIKSNFDVYDFELTKDEMASIEKLNTKKPHSEPMGWFTYRFLPKDYSDRE